MAIKTALEGGLSRSSGIVRQPCALQAVVEALNRKSRVKLAVVVKGLVRAPLFKSPPRPAAALAKLEKKQLVT